MLRDWHHEFLFLPIQREKNHNAHKRDSTLKKDVSWHCVSSLGNLRHAKCCILRDNTKVILFGSFDFGRRNSQTLLVNHCLIHEACSLTSIDNVGYKMEAVKTGSSVLCSLKPTSQIPTTASMFSGILGFYNESILSANDKK